MPWVWAGSVQVDGQTITYDDALSFRDFTGWDFRDRPEYDFSNKVIYASVFSQETPDSVIFLKDMTGATFVKCNLMNVVVDAAKHTVVQSRQERFQVQNDGMDWAVDAQLKPVEPLDKESYQALGLSIDPKDIPAQQLTENIILKTMRERAAQSVVEVVAP